MDQFLTTARSWSWPRDSFAWTWTAAASALLLVWFVVLRRVKAEKYNLPPGPPRWPIIGNAHLLMDSTKLPHQIVDDLSKIYGPIMLLKVGVQKFVFVSDPQMTVEFLKVHDHVFANRPQGMLACKYLLYGEKQLSFARTGDYHAFMRKFLATQLLSAKKLQILRGVRMEEQDLFIREVYNASVRKQPLDLGQHVQAMALNVISRLTFSRRLFGPGTDDHFSKRQQLAYLIPEANKCVMLVLAESCHPYLKWVDTLTGSRKRMLKCFRLMDARIQEILDDHKKALDALSPEKLPKYEAKDFVDSMLLQRNGEDSTCLDEGAIKGISLDLVGAGSETISTVTTWGMAELLANPEVMKKAREEVDSVVGKERLVTEADTAELPYLAAVIKETMRLHEPVPWLLPRSNFVSCKVGGYDIPTGSFVNINVYGMSRNPVYWKNPLKFDPNRFFGRDSTNVDFKGAYPQFLPFGSGRRICPGMELAQISLRTNLARFLHTFDWSIPKEGLDMSEKYGLTVGMKTSLKAVPMQRAWLAPHVYESFK